MVSVGKAVFECFATHLLLLIGEGEVLYSTFLPFYMVSSCTQLRKEMSACSGILNEC